MSRVVTRMPPPKDALEIYIHIKYHGQRDDESEQRRSAHDIKASHDGIEESALAAQIESAARQLAHHLPREHRKASPEDGIKNAQHEEAHNAYRAEHQDFHDSFFQVFHN